MPIFYKLPFFVFFFLISACAGTRSSSGDGPGMTVTFRNSLVGKKVHIVKIESDGISIPNPGGVSPSPNLNTGGSTMGTAPDARGLPEWVEFRWKEWPYPGEPSPKDYEAKQIWNEKVDELSRTLPIKSERVKVRERIPAGVIDQIMQSRHHPVNGKKLSLWILFRWYSDGIRFHWELMEGCCDVKQNGGDVID